MSAGRPRVGVYAALAYALVGAAPVLADSNTMGPVTVDTTGCSDKFIVNVTILNYASAYSCDYGLGVTNFSGAAIDYTLAVDAPPGAPIFGQGKHVSKSYEAVKVVRAPQSPNGPKTKIALACNPH